MCGGVNVWYIYETGTGKRIRATQHQHLYKRNVSAEDGIFDSVGGLKFTGISERNGTGMKCGGLQTLYQLYKELKKKEVAT